MSKALNLWIVAVLALLFIGAPVMAWQPYVPVPVVGTPVAGPGVQPPFMVWGKEFSHDLDYTVLGPSADPEQVIAWDGSGGTADTIDYSFTRPNWPPDQEVDAIANTRDALFDETIFDRSHLIFSHDDLIGTYTITAAGGIIGGPLPSPVSSAGPVIVSNGNSIAGAGEVSVEESGIFGPPKMQYTWAVQPQIDATFALRDVDGLEVWGPEPRQPVEDPAQTVIGDADKYSLDVDAPSGVSVWNASGIPYVSHPTIVSAVTALLGPIPASSFDLRNGEQGRNAINLDALMVSDILNEPETFDIQPDGVTAPADANGFEVLDQNGTPIYNPDRGDAIIFSIRQIVDPADPDGYYATGSELFVLDSWTGVSFLNHGGHVWDHFYGLSDLAMITLNLVLGDANNDGVVSADDFAAVQTNFGSTGPANGWLLGDANDDGVVSADDFAAIQTNFGNVATRNYGVIDVNALEAIGGKEPIGEPLGLADADTVPEPATLALLGLGALAITRRRMVE